MARYVVFVLEVALNTNQPTCKNMREKYYHFHLWHILIYTPKRHIQLSEMK